MAFRVVYLEDEPDMRELVRLILARRSVEYHTASGGLQGLELIRSTLPQLILLDLMMPELGGWEVYDILKNTPELTDIPVVIITARGEFEERLQNVRAAPNADDYILKPFGPGQLLDVVDRVMARKLS